MVPNYVPLPVVPVRGKGSRFWDQQEREYIDFAAGIAVTCLGHCHPHLVDIVQRQSQTLWHLSNVMTNEPAMRLAQKLCNATFAERVFFANSGGEANEAAFKLVRKYAFDHFGEQKHEIIAFNNAFHGRTLFTVTVGGQPKYRKGFEPVPAGVTHVPFNDIAALEKVISAKTCAVVMEPIQGEGGIIPADKEFAKAVRELCNRHDALLVFDEVQSGVGRSGELYAYMGLGVTPDILTSAKGLGGGFPVGAMLTTAKIAESFGFGTHGSTYGGNPMACAVAEGVIDQVNRPEFLQQVQQTSQYIRGKLENLVQRFDVFDQVRGKGLLLGLALSEAWQGRAKEVVLAALDQGVWVLVAGPNVVRLAPALNIEPQDIDEGMERFTKALATLRQ